MKTPLPPSSLQQSAEAYLRRRESELLKATAGAHDHLVSSRSLTDIVSFFHGGISHAELSLNDIGWVETMYLIQKIRDLHGDWLGFPQEMQDAKRERAERLTTLSAEVFYYLRTITADSPDALLKFTAKELREDLTRVRKLRPPVRLLLDMLSMLSQPVSKLGCGDIDTQVWRGYTKPFVSLEQDVYVCSLLLCAQQTNVGHTIGAALRSQISGGGADARHLGKSWELLLGNLLGSHPMKVAHEPNDEGSGTCDFRLTDDTATLILELKAPHPAMTETARRLVRERQHAKATAQLAGATDADAVKWLVTTSGTDIGTAAAGRFPVVDGFWIVQLLRHYPEIHVSRLISIYEHHYRGGPKPEPARRASLMETLITGDWIDPSFTERWQRKTDAWVRPYPLYAAEWAVS